ncbi:hypothetical protein GN244_ATG12728 [Phytophthora infestans]|uniref:Uncharacterized protein n=1 Tax=Phytophthora infestans TaxID=4787 RepID=A0A833RXV8_PHYIN|nr:hypothetical protein GN244_ATG12728 [Phytophthora infestans]
MPKDRFVASPFPEVQVSELERRELLHIVDMHVDDYLTKYVDHVVVDKRKVDDRRWEHVKSKTSFEYTRNAVTRSSVVAGLSRDFTQCNTARPRAFRHQRSARSYGDRDSSGRSRRSHVRRSESDTRRHASQSFVHPRRRHGRCLVLRGGTQ